MHIFFGKFSSYCIHGLKKQFKFQFSQAFYNHPDLGCLLIVVTSHTFLYWRNDGGEQAALFASNDGSSDLTKFSELSVIVDSRTGEAEGIRSRAGDNFISGEPAFGRIVGDSVLCPAEAIDVSVWGGCGIVAIGDWFDPDGNADDEDGGGGIIPFPGSTLSAIGREIAMSASVNDDGVGALGFTTLRVEGFDLDGKVSEKLEKLYFVYLFYFPIVHLVSN